MPHGTTSSSRSQYSLSSGESSYLKKQTVSPSASGVNRTDTGVATGCGDSASSRGHLVLAATSTHSIAQATSASTSASAASAPASAISPQGTENAQTFQTEFIRNLINEAIEDFRDEIHRDMLNLHVEMLRQFQIQLVGVLVA